jgi:DNA-binding NtrC family response regulator
MSTIVVYEEDDLMRGLLEEWLKSAGYQVRGHATHCAPQTGGADLLIASIYMPKQAGIRLVSELLTKYPATPVIAISGQFRAGLAAAGTTAQTLGVAQVIAKPLTRDALLGAVIAIIGPAA